MSQILYIHNFYAALLAATDGIRKFRIANKVRCEGD